MDKHNSLGGFRDSQGSVVGSTKVLVLADSTKEIRNVKHEGLSFQRKRCITFFLSIMLRMEVVDSQGDPCAVCGVRPYQVPIGRTKGC